MNETSSVAFVCRKLHGGGVIIHIDNQGKEVTFYRVSVWKFCLFTTTCTANNHISEPLDPIAMVLRNRLLISKIVSYVNKIEVNSPMVIKSLLQVDK